MNVNTTVCPTSWKWDFHMTRVTWLLQKSESYQVTPEHRIMYDNVTAILKSMGKDWEFVVLHIFFPGFVFC